MTSQRKQKIYTEVPPGHLLLSILNKFGAINELARHIELRDVIDEHQIMWMEANSVEMKILIHKRFRRQVARSTACFGGFEIAVHGTIMSAGGQLAAGSSLILVGIAVIYYMRK